MVQDAPNGAGSRWFKAHLTVLVQESSIEFKRVQEWFKGFKEFK